MRAWRGFALVLLGWLLPGAPAGAITSDDAPPPAADRAPDDYAAGLAAFEAADWPAVIAHMEQVIAARPWHADAHNRIGFAYRKLGDYDQALLFYDQALGLNPHHRGAMEYLGEAYLELDRPKDAEALLARLAIECERIADAPGDWRAECEEWQDLQAAYDAWRAPDPESATQ